MHEEDADLNQTMLDAGGPPIVPFLPPTEEPSSFVLAISVALVACLTIAICGNASQIVLQIYASRLNKRTPAQFFIAMLLLINFVVPFGLPPLILEKLVRIWMFGRLSCHAHHILAATERVITPWGIAFLHASVAFFLSRQSRLSKHEGILSLLAFFALLLVVLLFVIPEGMAAELEMIRKDEIESEQYIMLIHTIRCVENRQLHPLAETVLGFAVPLLLCTFLLIRIWCGVNASCRSAISRNLLYTLLIHYPCNVLCYAPAAAEDLLLTMMPDDVELQRLLPFLAPTVMWYPLSQLSAAISRHNLDKIEEDGPRSRTTLRGTEMERSHLMCPQVDI
ncbi:hypothetical protein Y032_0225g2763 [Ancylostoma ceylanicum]|uniref:G-protein coupled receptors family 1 profile domain-containing protein n=1 Tax=Ancylostoma ceylanicum TaxID=53326 RepID=A0A016SI35_9BILA|nr:hypothetical protein Y032_0225g2763 [Ancylostoma ceylanicum]